MNHLAQLITDMALILVACTVVTLLFRKIKLSVVLGYILSGFLISPHFTFLPTVVDRGDITVWANIGVIFLMFGIGLEFSFKRIAKVGMAAIITALTTMVSMCVIGSVLGLALGYNRINSLFLGAMIAMSSTMIIMKTFEEHQLKNRRFAQIVMGSMVVEDIGGIFLMIILATLGSGQNVSGMALTLQLVEMLLFLVIWLVAGIFLIPSILRKTGKLLNDELLLLFSLAVCFAMVIIASKIGFSEALGAFMGGSILAGTIQGEKIQRLVKPLKDVFGAIFFVSIGMMIVPETMIHHWPTILILCFVVLVGQRFFATLGILFSGNPLETAVKGGSAMMQIGEFSFIIAAMGTTLGVLDNALYQSIVIVAAITIFLSPVSIGRNQKSYDRVVKILPNKILSWIEKYTQGRTSTKSQENDWSRYLKTYAVYTGLSFGMLMVIYLASIRFVGPYLSTLLPAVTGKSIAAAVTILAMMIPMGIMLNRRTNLLLKLWFSSMTNRLPLILLAALRQGIGVIFLMLVLRHYFVWPLPVLALLAVVLLILVIRSDVVRKNAFRIRARFIAKLNEKTLHRRHQEKDADWFYNRIWVAVMQAGDFKDGRQIMDMYESRLFDMRVIKIIRGRQVVLMPDGEFVLGKGDEIHIVGTKDRVEAYRELLKKEDKDFHDYQQLLPLKKYINGQEYKKIPAEEQILCGAIRGDGEAHFTGRSIR